MAQTKQFAAKFWVVSFYFFILTGCTTIPLPDSAAFQGGAAFSQKSFATGNYRFSQGGWPFGDLDVSQAIHEQRYADALNLLVQTDKASDKSYNDLGWIAEVMGHYQAASIYYGLAAALHEHDQLSKCKNESELMDPNNPEDILFSNLTLSTCYKLDLRKLNASESRASRKARGSWKEHIIEYDDGSIYIGQIDELGQPSGLGELSATDRSFYKGEFFGGKKSGVGTMKIRLDSNDLFFVGTFSRDNPRFGVLYNPSMKTMGYAFSKVMRYQNGGFYYLSGDALGSKPADNNYWFSGGWGQALGSAITQGTVMHQMNRSPLFATTDPLISRVCESSPLVAGAAKGSRLCD